MKNKWESVSLEDVCEFIDRRGVTPVKLGSEFISAGYRVISAKNIKRRQIDLAAGEHRFVDEFTYRKWMKSPLLVDDVLLTSEAPLGELAYIAEQVEWCLGQRLFGIRTNKAKLYGRFLFYALQTNNVRDELHSRATGATAQGIRQAQLKRVAIDLPAVSEQRRIVGILDKAFEGIAAAKSNAEKNVQNARALFESHLQAIFTQRGDGWVETTIGQHIRFIDYRGKTPIKTQCGLRLITARNVKMGYIQETPMEFIASESYDAWMTRGIPKMGDVLFTTEAPLANVAQLDTEERVAFAQRVIIMQPDNNTLDCTFLKYLLLSSPVQKRIRDKGTGATVQGIKASLLKLIEISFPAQLAIQRHLVAKLDTLTQETKRLESLYQRKLTALDELKKSLLHQAFSGEL
jgi:type I restriction enzyme, S subunit